MTTVIEHIEGHYETQSMSYGQAYVWYPECVVVECDCGETQILYRLGFRLPVWDRPRGIGPRNHGFRATVGRITHPWDHEY